MFLRRSGPKALLGKEASVLEGLTLRELEMQAGGLLPERVEMRKSKITAGGNVTNAAGTGGAGGQCVGIANNVTVGPAVSCAGGNGGNATMKA
jgi:hypothetical protein